MKAAVLLAVLCSVAHAEAAEYYVSPTGSDSNAGTLAAPFATLQKGNDVAAAGDTVWLRGGTYQNSKQIKLNKSGKSDTERIKFWAYQAEVPVLDFSKYVSTNTAVDSPTILVSGSFLHLKGLEVANGAVGASGAHSNDAIRSEGASNNIFELLNIHHNFGPGLFISKGNGGHLILNCDSHDNYDKDGSQGDGQNADGFGVHYQTTGPSTIIRGCRAWIDSDDGYDLIQQEVPVLIENSWAISNGYSNGGSGKPADGNGNGFKAGSSDTGIRHILQHNVAWKNRAAGFYANHSSGGNTWLNNTSYMNAVQYNMLASPAGDSGTTITLSGALAHKMRNNIGFPNKNTNMSGVDSMFNTWDLNITEATGDFASTSDTGFMGPRQADGSLPALDFLKLKANSPLIDKGTDVGLPFVGSAPDLGAYEYGATTSSTGGTGGSSSASGGSNGSAGKGNAGAGPSPSSGGSASAAGGASGIAGSSDVDNGGSSTVGGNAPAGSAVGGSAVTSHAGQGAAPAGAGSGTSMQPGDSAGCTCTMGRGARVPGYAALLLLSAALLQRRRRAPRK
ncbi:MAG TPA: right-handed parallel beta-helix repeat-containing protein [Polyangiaceae bacterium]|nr:right-handed parallel beta-helix repeat-containing protein [Polyangiaceae bacterium]